MKLISVASQAFSERVGEIHARVQDRFCRGMASKCFKMYKLDKLKEDTGNGMKLKLNIENPISIFDAVAIGF